MTSIRDRRAAQARHHAAEVRQLEDRWLALKAWVNQAASDAADDFGGVPGEGEFYGRMDARVRALDEVRARMDELDGQAAHREGSGEPQR